MRSLDIAGTGMQAQQTNVEVISNNIANMTTTGFKRRRAEFQDLIYQNLRRVGSSSSDTGTIVPSGAQVGLGVRTAAIYRIGEQGNLQQTSNSLDVAISGNGYFQVTLPSCDTAYTRDGTFGLAPDAVRPEAELEQLGVDSLAAIEFMFELEDHFKIRLADERTPIKTVQDVIDVVEKAQSAQTT